MAGPTRIERVAHETKVHEAIDFVDRHETQTAEYLASIAAIIAPSGNERQRAEAVAQRMRQIGLPNVSIDDAPNVVGVIPGRSAKVLVFVSTLDDLATEPEQELVFAAVAQEETGMAGMRKLYAQYKAKATAFVDLVGDGRRIAFGAIGIHWWKVVATGPGPIGGGTPAIGISGERGGQRGFPDEWADIPGYLTVHGAHGTRASIPMPASGLHTTTDCRPPRH